MCGRDRKEGWPQCLQYTDKNWQDKQQNEENLNKINQKSCWQIDRNIQDS